MVNTLGYKDENEIKVEGLNNFSLLMFLISIL